jgi:hypothetical protein
MSRIHPHKGSFRKLVCGDDGICGGCVLSICDDFPICGDDVVLDGVVTGVVTSIFVFSPICGDFPICGDDVVLNGVVSGAVPVIVLKGIGVAGGTGGTGDVGCGGGCIFDVC